MSFKSKLRISAAGLLYASGVTRPDRRSRGRLSIVTFHRVLPEEERRLYPYPGLVVTPQELDALLGYLARHFECATLEAAHARFLAGEERGRPLLALTFDDAQQDNHRNARPLLRRHGLKASFFVPVEAVAHAELLWHDRLGFAIAGLLRQGDEARARVVGLLRESGLGPTPAGGLAEHAVSAAKRLSLDSRGALVEALERECGAEAPAFARMMSFDELAELAAEGHEIGSHSMTHCLMTECDEEALRREVGESRRTLEQRLGLPIASFCYPNGNCDERAAAAVAAAGYRRAVTTTWGDNGRDANPFTLRRFDMDSAPMLGADGDLAPALVAWRMSGLHPGLRFSA